MFGWILFGSVGGFWLWVLFRFFNWRARLVRSITGQSA